MEVLPDDIVTEIFSYLPAKSASRFGCISRAWHATISSPSFVQLHLQRANRPGELKVFISLPRESYFYAWKPGGAATKLAPHKFNLPTPLTRPLHGLVLIRCTNTGYHICNPSTGATLALPDTQLSAKMIWRPSRGQVVLPYYLDVAYGLGYCSVSREYKVVRLFSRVDNTPVLCEVFVLGTLAYWRPTAQQPPMCLVDMTKPGVFLHGCLHFLCRDSGILTFDVTEETFGSVLPPPMLEDAPIKMTELDGCLCICHGCKNYGAYGDGTYLIWMLRNYKVGKWEQLCRVYPTAAWMGPERRVQLDSYWIAPLCMYNKDDDKAHRKTIMFDTGSCKVFAIHVTNGASTLEVIFNPDETIGGSFADFGEPSLGLFEESLVPVGCTIEEMVLSSPKIKAWFDILKWMPTRSVSDLSLVCRAWRATIKDDNFIRSHVVHANLNKSPRIMMVMDSNFGGYMDLEDIIDQGVQGTQESTYLVCSQPCHGLNAGTFHSRSFVCNPVRGHVQNIVLDGVDDDAFFAGQTGMGYHSKYNMHVLVLVTYKVKNLATRVYERECKLRYMDEQHFRSIDPPPRPVADVPPTNVDEKIFWLVEPNLGPVPLNCEIMAFDVHTREFDVLEGPPCSSHANGHVSILRLHGALCMACSDKSSNVIDMWMMKEVGIWRVEYHIELEEFSPEYSAERTTPLTVNPVDGRVLLTTGQSLGYYDTKTAAMETLYRYVDMQWKFCPIICDESFVDVRLDGDGTL